MRTLEASDWEAFRKIRLHALRTEPGVFYASYDSEIKLLPADWRALTAGDDQHQIFGLFDSEHLIGITAVFTWRDDPTGTTAVFAMSYIRPEYRGRALSALFYETRLAWVQSKPQFSRITVSHRLSNEVSRRANQRFGFKMTDRVAATWPDGSTEDEVLYELALDDIPRE